MRYKSRTDQWWVAGIFLCLFGGLSCSKGGGDSSNPNVCAGITVTVTGSVTNATLGMNDGKIEGTATGGSGSLTFSLNGGAFQASGTFLNLAKGSYTLTAKYANGCTGSATFQVNETDPCSSTITVTGSATQSDPCNPSGIVTITAAGGTGFTYSLNSGTFQASNVFNNVQVGNHTIMARDAAGCSKSGTVNVTTIPSGPLFAAVRALVTANCAVAGCHAGTQPPNFTVDCNIILNKTLVKARAVDGTPSFMPPTGPLPISEREKISNWINAGGRFTD